MDPQKKPVDADSKAEARKQTLTGSSTAPASPATPRTNGASTDILSLSSSLSQTKWNHIK